MSAHVLLNLLSELGKKIRCEALPSILSVFPNVFNKFNQRPIGHNAANLAFWLP